MHRGRRDEGAAVEAAGCYTAGSVAGAVLGTALACLCLLAAAYAFWRFYWRPRRGKHLVLVTDPENGKDDYAFDNPCFREGTPLGRTLPSEKDVAKLDQKNRWSAWSPLGVLGVRGDKRRALDDSFLVEPQVNTIALRSHDFTGLGFNICGNMRDGIYIKDVLHRGPASESGRIAPGDRIDSVRISFRHMVFEDALTILSYASPYEVQLEVENASSSRPSTLIRTKRSSGSNIAFGDRICHPFYRSQSIADLAQIGKDSLKRMQQMEGITKSPRTIKSESLDDSGTGDYPTLKLSSSPSNFETRRENAGFEKATAPPRSLEPAVVKPERTKRGGAASPEAHSPEDGGTLSKFQKFGVRVLPDPNAGNTMKVNNSVETNKVRPAESPGGNAPAEPERHQNEQNFIIEKGNEEVSPTPRKQQNKQKINVHPPTDVDVVDGRRPIAETFYDERGIDVGPVELQKHATSAGHTRSSQFDSKNSDLEGQSEMGNEGAKESNVKQLITKGFQNLKEKFHPIDRNKTCSTSETTDDESCTQNERDPSFHSHKYLANGNKSVEIAKNSKDTLNNEMSNKTEGAKHFSSIPTNIPEEVRRAAIAAVNNRRSSGNMVLHEEGKPVAVHAHERSRTTSQDSISGDSSSEGDGKVSAANYDPDSGDKMPKKSYKRKAPLPPPEGEEEVEHSLVESSPSNSPIAGRSSHTHSQQIKTEIISIKGISNPNPSHAADKILTSFGNVGLHLKNPEKEKLENSSTPEAKKNVYNDREKEFDVCRNICSDADMSNQDLSNANLSDVNTDSDSDGDKNSEEFYEAKKSRKNKGGTKIELNSSHITVHHNPTDIAVDLENESTRKAASLGDLSRLDSEQPMSILERAVSLDMADGGTPHGTKKRKAPLPPPGDDYLLSAQDSDEGTSYKKEPRLEGAMDTFQRRRLKKSSDWGTLEEALQQNDQKNFSDQKNFLLNTNTAHVTQSKTDVPKQSSITLEPDTGTEEKHSVETILHRHEHPNIHTASIIESFIISEKKHSDSLKVRPTESSTKMLIESSTFKVIPPKNENDGGGVDGLIQANEHQQRMVLHVNPQTHLTSSQVTVLPATTSTYELYGTATGNDDSASTRLETVSSSENPSSRIVSSTPLHSISHEAVSSVPRNQLFHSERHALQSPLISSSNVGVSNVHVTSTQDSSDVDLDPNMLITSATDPFVTAMTTADSTTYNENFEDDSTWEQPPELPTSPMPASSSYIASPSMTYITEIQVLTSTDNNHDSLLEIKAPSSTKNVLQDTNRVSSVAQDRPGSSLSSDSIGSRGEQEEMEAILAESGPHTSKETIATGHAMPALKNNVTVTAIRNTMGSSGNIERSRIPTRIQPDSVKGLNHVEETKVKPARPPVPPRKSEASSSFITVQVPVSNHTTNTSASSGKFISFSSLTPRSYPQDSVPGRSSSFEKWVFLDDANTSNTTKFNGLESASNDEVKNTQQHSTVVTFPTSTPNRTQTITHIVLDTKSGNNTGKNVEPSY